jgi:hypothetical protein
LLTSISIHSSTLLFNLSTSDLKFADNYSVTFYNWSSLFGLSSSMIWKFTVNISTPELFFSLILMFASGFAYPSSVHSYLQLLLFQLHQNLFLLHVVLQLSD